MNVRTLCLAILNLGNATGYEIRKLSTEGHFSHFVDASFGSIYPALNKLETDGLVTMRDEMQPGKPARKVYAITEEGRLALCDALAKPMHRDIFKSGFLLLAMCAEMLDRETVRKAIEAQYAYLNDELAVIAEARGSVDLRGADWVAEYGEVCIRASLDYLDKNRQQLEAIAGTNMNRAGFPQAAE